MTAEPTGQRAADPVPDESSSQGRVAAWRSRLSERRERLRHRRVANATYRTGVGLVGTAVLALGIIAIPYPGPGWAIFFLGLAILATEFGWARRSLKYAKSRYDGAMEWFGRQHLLVQSLGTLLTAAVVVTTLWLMGAVGWGANLAGIDWPWLKSPLGFGS